MACCSLLIFQSLFSLSSNYIFARRSVCLDVFFSNITFIDSAVSCIALRWFQPCYCTSTSNRSEFFDLAFCSVVRLLLHSLFTKSTQSVRFAILILWSSFAHILHTHAHTHTQYLHLLQLTVVIRKLDRHQFWYMRHDCFSHVAQTKSVRVNWIGVYLS